MILCGFVYVIVVYGTEESVTFFFFGWWGLLLGLGKVVVFLYWGYCFFFF